MSANSNPLSNEKQKTKTSISLDLGMDLGFCYDDGNGPSQWEARRFKTYREGVAYCDYVSYIRPIFGCMKPDAIIIEDVFGHWKNALAARYYFAFRGLTEMVAAFYGIPIVGYKPSEIKKHILGHGKADKVDSLTFARSLCDSVANDDVADAIAISTLHRKVLTGEIVLEPKKKKPKKKKL